MEWDKEKSYLDQIHNYMMRVNWLAKKLVELGQCIPDKQPHWKCGEENSCVFCWIAASGRVANKAKDNGKS